ncbi:hypothetical protein GCM10023163_25920 [Aestuariibaculum suncheonense]
MNKPIGVKDSSGILLDIANSLKRLKTFNFILSPINFLIIFAPCFGLTSGENRVCCSELNQLKK